MAERVFLHIGIPKSGTSYLQAVFAANKSLLMEQSALLFPGETWADQVSGVLEVRGMRVPRHRRHEHRGAWQALVDEIAAWRGDAVVSMEWLCAAEPDQIKTVVDSFGKAETHVVLTARDLGRTVPAAWQESVKKGRDRSWSWPEFLELVTAEDSRDRPGGRRFWAQQDVEGILANWGRRVPSDRTHVVTVPPAGSRPEELWHRMCQVLDIDGSSSTTEVVGRNESFALETVEVLRRLRPATKELKITRDAFKRFVHYQLDHGSRKPGTGTKLTVPMQYHPWLREQALDQIAAVRTSGAHVVGELDDLLPAGPEPQSRQPEDVTQAALLDAAIEALAVAVGHFEPVAPSSPPPSETPPGMGTSRRPRRMRRLIRDRHQTEPGGPTRTSGGDSTRR